MVDFARLPTQPLRRNRLKLNPQNHVRVLTFLYAGSLSLAAAKMLGPTSAETFVAIVFFLVYGVFLNLLIWHHFIKYLCQQKKVRFDTVTHLWKDDSDYVFDTMWQGIYDTVRDGVAGTLHPYFYRLGYYALLLAKALVLGMPTDLMSTSQQMQFLLGIEALMLVTFAVSCLPFAAIIMNIVQPLTHVVNMAVYAMIVFYDDGTGCQFSDQIQNTFIGLTATASALPLIGLGARFVEIRVRITLHNRKLAKARELEDLATGGVDISAADGGSGGGFAGSEESGTGGADPVTPPRSGYGGGDSDSDSGEEVDEVDRFADDWLKDEPKLLTAKKATPHWSAELAPTTAAQRELMIVIDRLLDERKQEAQVRMCAYVCFVCVCVCMCCVCVCVCVRSHVCVSFVLCITLSCSSFFAANDTPHNLGCIWHSPTLGVHVTWVRPYRTLSTIPQTNQHP